MVTISLQQYLHFAFLAGIALLFGSFYLIGNILLLQAALWLSFGAVLIAALQDLWHRKLGSELFFVIAAIIGIIGHQEEATVIILFVMMIAELLADIVAARTEQALAKLIKLMPTTVTILRNGNQETIDITALQLGMQVIVPTGARIPVDGTVITGEATVNESALTGESLGIEKKAGSTVYASTFVEAGSLIIRTDHIGQETMFGRITKLLAAAEEQKATIIGIADRIAIIFSFAILAIAAITWLWTGDLTTVITLLVFGSPTELVLITPLAVLAGIAASFKQGILIKGGVALETLARVTTLIVDKTGTLTTGNPTVQAVYSFDPTMTENDIITIAASAEQFGAHIMAQAVKQYAVEKKLPLYTPEQYSSLAGHGISATIHGTTYLIGNHHFITSHEHGNITMTHEQEQLTNLPSFYVATTKKVIGLISIYDPIRPTAAATIAELQQAGIRSIVMLSGDRQEVADAVGHAVGITTCLGNQFPEEKLAYIKKLQERGEVVAMLGDGINDAPALKAASVGIALGAMGMEPAIAAADIVLIGNDLTKITFLYALAKHVFRTISQNIIFGLGGVHGIGIIAALLGWVTPVQAAMIHAGADLFIVINSARIIDFLYSKQRAR